jgi:hypothetical protein
LTRVIAGAKDPAINGPPAQALGRRRIKAMSGRTQLSSRAIGVIAAIAVAVTTAGAQGTDTGSLRGRITDNTGAALPGVTVTATSGAVMGGSLVAVTSDEGLYRFPALPPGVYSVRMELPGFTAAVIEDLRITVGLGLTLDRQLGVASIEETLTVVGESPIVDTRNTEAGATVTKEILELVPSSRDLWNTVQQVPGLVVPRENVGGFESTQLSAMSVHGSGASAVQHNINGIDMTLMHQDNLGAGYMSTDAFEEVQVATSGISAEHSRGGLIINQVVKSGSNDFHGLVGYFHEGDETMSSNVDDDLRSRGVLTEGSPLDELRDFTAQLGGPIARDKLWFFGAFRQYSVLPFVLNCFLPDGSRCTNEATLRNYTGKLNAQLKPENRFLFFYEWGQKFMPNRDISELIRPEASYKQDGAHEIIQARYDRIISPTVLFEASYGQLESPFPLRYRDEVGDRTTAFDEVTRIRFDAAPQNFFQRGQMQTFRSNVSVFRDKLVIGAHDLKAGFEYRHGEVPETTARNGDLQRIYRNGVPAQVWVYNTPVERNAENQALMGFIQDSANFGRLTATLGLRVEDWRGWLPEQRNNPATYASVFGGAKTFAEQEDLIAWTTWSPRVGVIFDLFGNSRTIAKASFGRYFNQIEGNRINGVANSNGVAEARFDWTDLNGNNYPDANEFGALRSINIPSARGAISPDLESPYSDEVSTSVEQALNQRMSVSVRYTYRRNEKMLAEADLALPDSAYTVPSTAIDPLTGATLNYWSVNPAIGTVRNNIILTQFDSNYTRYHGVDLVFDRRFDGRWLARGSVTFQDNYGRVGGYLNRNDREIFPYGAAGLDAKRLVRLQTSYVMPWDINTAVSFRHTSGLNSFSAVAQSPSPMARLVQVRDATTNQLYQIRVEENGSYRQEPVNVLDLRASKSFRFRGLKIEGMFDLFNVLNANNVLAAGTLTGSNLDRPSVVLTPRVARLGVKLDF